MGGGWAVDGDGFIKLVIIINNIRRWLCVLRAHQGQEQRLCQRQSLACFELIKDKNRSDRRLKIAYQVELYTIVLLACQDLWSCSDKEGLPRDVVIMVKTAAHASEVKDIVYCTLSGCSCNISFASLQRDEVEPMDGAGPKP